MPGNFLIRGRAAVLPTMAFNEVGESLLFGRQGLHTVQKHTIAVSVRVNDFSGSRARLVGLPLGKSLALNCLVPASPTLLIPDPRPLVERLGDTDGFVLWFGERTQSLAYAYDREIRDADLETAVTLIQAKRRHTLPFHIAEPGAEKPIGPDDPQFSDEDWNEP